MPSHLLPDTLTAGELTILALAGVGLCYGAWLFFSGALERDGDPVGEARRME